MFALTRQSLKRYSRNLYSIGIEEVQNMKRYVKEFATDRIKSLEYAREDIKQKAIERINKIVNRCERGFITNLEAVQQIIKAIEEV